MLAKRNLDILRRGHNIIATSVISLSHCVRVVKTTGLVIIVAQMIFATFMRNFVETMVQIYFFDL